jgi:hypothetical protein
MKNFPFIYYNKTLKFKMQSSVVGRQPVIRSGAPSPSKYGNNEPGTATHLGQQIIMQPHYIQDASKTSRTLDI